MRPAPLAPFRSMYIPVEVVTAPGGVLTRQTFQDMRHALVAFPGLDLFEATPGFTWAMRGEVDGQLAARFESDEANARLSQ